jgi:regulator of nonsense transcripts 2
LRTLLEEELPECHRREQLDELAEKFCTNHGSSRTSRRRLQETLYQIPRSRLDMIPLYARLVATLDRVWPDFGQRIVIQLEQQFHGQAKFKKNQNIDSRLRTAKYLCELTKFRVAAPITALRCLQRCLDDFSSNNVDIACCMLEGCGRFLFHMQHSRTKLKEVMESMDRLSKAKVRRMGDHVLLPP